MAVRGRDRDADTDRHRDVAPVRQCDLQCFDTSDKAFCCVDRFFLVRVWNCDDEFLTSQTGDHIGCAQIVGQLLGYLDKNLVAECMAIDIIDLFKMVQISQKNREFPPLSRAGFQGAFEMRDRITAIVNSRQRSVTAARKPFCISSSRRSVVSLRRICFSSRNAISSGSGPCLSRSLAPRSSAAAAVWH